MDGLRPWRELLRLALQFPVPVGAKLKDGCLIFVGEAIDEKPQPRENAITALLNLSEQSSKLNFRKPAIGRRLVAPLC